MSDIIVVGGSIMGSSFAYHMAMAGHADAVHVIEPDPTYEFAAAPRSAGGVRLMHSLPENIAMSVYGQAVYRNFAELMDVAGEPGTFPYRNYGYLHLVAGRDAVATIEENCRVQNAHGANNELLSRDEVAARFPVLRTDDIDAGLFGPDDGLIDPYAAVMGFRRKAESLGVRYTKGRVVGVTSRRNVVTGVALEGGAHLKASALVNVAGSWAPGICAMVGMKIPVEPARRVTFYYETDQKIDPLPLTKEPGGLGFEPKATDFRRS